MESYEFTGKLSKNTLTIRQEGPNYVEFKDKSRIVFHLPCIKVKGMLLGDRLTHYHGVAKFHDPLNGIKAVIKMSSAEKKGFFGTRKHDTFDGKLYYANTSTEKKTFKSIDEEEEDDLKFADVKQEISVITGSFLENLAFDGVDFWNIQKQKPSRYKPTQDPLPSDFRFREDLIWLKYGNANHASDWKIRLEEQQRYDRKLRGADK